MWKLGLRPRYSQKGIHKWDFRCSAAAILLIRRARGAIVKTPAIHLKDTATETAAILAEIAAVLVAKTAADNKHCESRALETAAFLIQLISVLAEKQLRF